MFKAVLDKVLIWLFIPKFKMIKRQSSHAGPGREAGRASWRAAEDVKVKFCTNLFSRLKRGAND